MLSSVIMDQMPDELALNFEDAIMRQRFAISVKEPNENKKSRNEILRF